VLQWLHHKLKVQLHKQPQQPLDNLQILHQQYKSQLQQLKQELDATIIKFCGANLQQTLIRVD
jgi:hypothetical protein